MAKVYLQDGKLHEFEGNTAADIAKGISPRLYKVALAAKVDDKTVGLSETINDGANVRILTFEDEEGRETLWHSASHIMAQAVKRVFKNEKIKLGIGPAIQNGFYYDFDMEHRLSQEDFAAIEAEMKKIVVENLPITRFELSREEALEWAEQSGETYKQELINDLPEDEVVSFYKQGEFVDLCAGPHVPSTGRVKHFKILSVAGAYWRGSEKNPMMQRLYATAFESKKDLDEYILRLEEAKKRDHRKLGKELDLFSIQEQGPGFPFFHPKGMIIKNELLNFWRKEHRKHGYQEISTPIILSESLWRQSGHWDHYKENMYFIKIDEQDYAVKPMNCPGGMLTFKRKQYSYRDLPIRLAEIGLVHRHELSGALHGLMRVRCFHQDDAHIFMEKHQMEDEIIGVLELTDKIYSVFGLKYSLELSTRPEDSMGSDEDWETATQTLIRALEKKGLKYDINEGDGAFYGPKIDIHLEDSIGRKWQCGTIQLDFQMPERFDLTYDGQDGEKHRPVMLHRVVFGAIERFIAILTEHFAGAFPLWMAPVQAKVLTITDRSNDYADKITKELQNADIRVEVDKRNEKIGYKIRQAQLEKIPYMLIIGDKEIENRTVSVRRRSQDIGSMPVEDVICVLREVIDTKKY